MDKAYRLGQLLNVFFVGMLCGVTLYATIRHAEAYEAERAAVRVRKPRVMPRPATRGIDIGQIACGWAAPAKAREMGWR